MTFGSMAVDEGGPGGPPPQTGTSIFDPVLCELIYSWFSPPGGTILDPFAGGSVRGIVASKLGRAYHGIDLSGRQLAANREQAEVIVQPDDPAPVWYDGNSLDMDSLLPVDLAADFVFSCPPYFDLEVYSDNGGDLSAMSWEGFRDAYQEIIQRAVRRLRDDRFACFVVGDVRDKRGAYRHLPGTTVEMFAAAGCALYNDAVLVTAVGSLPLRTGQQFRASRKLGKTHQNVLIFVKGDSRAAAEACGSVTRIDLREPARPPIEPEDDAESKPEDAVRADRVPVKISAKSMRLEFNGCDPDFIANVCHGRCCWVEGNPKGTTIHLEADQVGPIRELGAEVDESNVMVTENKRCVFQNKTTGLCDVHFSGHKPRSCIQSPLMITERDTLTIRNRYKMLPCFKAEPRLPVYRAFSAALRLLFGEEEAERITQHLDAGGGDMTGWMLRDRYAFNKTVRDIWNAQQVERAARPGPTDAELTALTPVERHDEVWLKRDDLFEWQGVRGAKARAGFLLARGAFGLVTCGSRHSRQVREMALVANVLGIPCRAHVPSGTPGDEIAEAKQFGAEIVSQQPGYNTVLISRARDDARASGRKLIPFGMGSKEAVDLAAAQTANLPAEAQRVVVPVGSGTNLAGVLKGLAERGREVPVLGVRVGSDPTKNLDALGPKNWRQRCELATSPEPYDRDAKGGRVGDVELDRKYEAKCLPFLAPGDCLWLVGGPPE